MAILRFVLLLWVQYLSRAFFRFSVLWVGEAPKAKFSDVRLIVLLNHTSLFEPIFTAIVPTRLLWDVARRGVVPGADVTLNRPLAGGFYKLLAPNVVTITRKRDETWERFLETVSEKSMVLIAAEGRMKRRSGLDKDGQPMTVRGGVADILRKFDAGNMLIIYSGGLHHVHAPGDKFPHLFQRVSTCLEQIDIAQYKRALMERATAEVFKERVVADLEYRRDRYCRSLPPRDCP